MGIKHTMMGLAAIAAGVSFGAQAGAQETPQTGIMLPPVQVIQKKAEPARKPKPRLAKRPRTKTPPVAATLAAPPAAGAAISLSPVKGSEIAIAKVPGAVSKVSAADVADSGSPAIEQALQQNVPGVIISDVTGNAFSADIQYRGFTASAVEGTPQGLAVYQNGVRVNEIFGDTVNWDMIPAAAIKDIGVVSGNPLYGLNALGGALTVTMKDGFGFHGVESDTRAGSFGRWQESLQIGQQAGNFAAYLALEGIGEEGWRDFSSSQVRRMYADLGAKGRHSEFHVNFTGAENTTGAIGPTPVQMLDADYGSVYTNPQTSKNDLAMVSANGSVSVSDRLNLSGVGYFRHFAQKHVDANFSEVARCDPADPSQGLCLNGDPLTYKTGSGYNYLDSDVIGEIDRTSVDANSLGGTLQATSKAPVLGHSNQFTIGASADHGEVQSKASAELGVTNPQNLVVTGTGVMIEGPQPVAPVDVKTTTDYYGAYVSNTFDLTRALSLTAGGRFNYENIQLADQIGTALNGTHVYTRFNPMAGATYKLAPGLSVYGGYAEANRAPTPAELSCADPLQPCLMANFLVSDPELKQVVSHTLQAGVRGNAGTAGHPERLDWSVGLFRTLNTDDIINVADPAIIGRGYYMNGGETLRQGVEASVKYRLSRTTLYANYSYVDATFQSDLQLPSNSPTAMANGGINTVHRGDHLPSIPEHRLKAGVNHAFTDAWKAGIDMVLVSDQYLAGDENNQNPKLPGYAVFNLHTSYEITRNVQIYGLVNNLFDHKYATYGTYFQTDIANAAGDDAGFGFTGDARTITPAQPLSVYGGLKVKF